MAKLLGNMLQGLSGRLGDVVGYTWNGVQCVRSRPKMMRNPRTAAQQAHREQFRQEVQLAAQMRYALIKGLGMTAREYQMTPQNLFMRVNREAFGWDEGRLTVDYERLVLSTGPVSPVVFEEPVLDSNNVLTVRFRKHRPGGGGGSFDSVFVFVYNPEQQLGYLAAPALRREGRVSFVMPEWMRGGELQMWGFVQDERGRCSETLYIGYGEAELAMSSEVGVRSFAGGTPVVQEGQGEEALGLDWQTQPSTESTAHYGGRSYVGGTPAVQDGRNTIVSP